MHGRTFQRRNQLVTNSPSLRLRTKVKGRIQFIELL